jgi:hypothetical protein
MAEAHGLSNMLYSHCNFSLSTMKRPWGYRAGKPFSTKRWAVPSIKVTALNPKSRGDFRGLEVIAILPRGIQGF